MSWEQATERQQNGVVAMDLVTIRRLTVAMLDLVVCGCPDRPVKGRGYDESESRMKAIEDALAAIQKDGAAALRDEFIGIKNYAAFGDQRADCRYYCGPRHGAIVFKITRARNSETVLGDDHIELLLAVRDFNSVKDPRGNPQHRHGQEWLNLCDVLKWREKAELDLEQCNAMLTDTMEESR